VIKNEDNSYILTYVNRILYIVNTQMDPNKLAEEFKGKIDIIARIPKKYVKSIRQLVNAYYNYLETRYINRWIKNRNIRYIAFLLCSDQIARIINSVSEEEEKLTIIFAFYPLNISKYGKLIEIPLQTDEDSITMMQQAFFRVKLEKERGKLTTG